MPALFLAPATVQTRITAEVPYSSTVRRSTHSFAMGSARSGWAALKTQTLWIAMERSHLGIRAYLRMPAWLSSEKGLCTG